MASELYSALLISLLDMVTDKAAKVAHDQATDLQLYCELSKFSDACTALLHSFLSRDKQGGAQVDVVEVEQWLNKVKKLRNQAYSRVMSGY